MTSDPKLPFSGEPALAETPVERHPDSASAGGSAPPESPATRMSAARLWLRRLGVLLFVFLCATAGVMLMIIPWRPEWSENPLLMAYPWLHEVVSSGFVRGVVTGLGLLNIWMGFWEALQYRED